MGTMLSCNVNKVRSATLKGRKYLVANVTLIVPGVLNGSKGALFYPRDEVSHPNNVDAWNGMPLVNGHPTENGTHVSARSPGIQERFGLGHVYNAKINPKTGSLRAQAWFDVESMERVEPRLLAALKAGRPVEVSTGLFTHDEPAPMGSVYNGREYQYIARKYRPDHLAILIDQEGACSLRDGCGVMVENAGKWVTTDDGNHLFLDDKGNTLMTAPGGKPVEGGSKKGKKDKRQTEDEDGVFKSKHDGTEYSSKDDRDSDDRYFDKKKSAATKAKASEDAIRAKLESVKKAGPTSPKIEALKKAKGAVDAKIGKLKQKLDNTRESRQIKEKVLGESQSPIKKTISDEDWDKNVAGLEQARSKYRQARKSGDKISSDAWLRQARRFRKTLIGNAATVQRRAQLIVLNCGGKGGKPGPCPSVGLVEHLTSEKLYDPQEFRTAYTNLEEGEKKAVVKNLAKRGLINPIDARKRGVMTASEIIASAKGQYQKAKLDHQSVPTNRHIPFQDSEAFKKMAGVTANCGGPGSGKPGPCPVGGSSQKTPSQIGRYLSPDEARGNAKVGDTPFIVRDKAGKMVGLTHDENFASSEAKKHGGKYGFSKWKKVAKGTARNQTVNCGGPGSGVPGPCPENKPDSPTSRKVAPTLDLSKVKPSQPLNRETPEYLDAKDKADRATYLAKMVDTPPTGDTTKFSNEAQVASKLASRGGKRLPGRTDGGRHSSLHKKAASAHAKAATAHKEASSKLAITKPDAALKHAKAAEAHSAASTAHTKAGHELMIVGNKMLLNCGGPGSGKPGPCPNGGNDRAAHRAKRLEQLDRARANKRKREMGDHPMFADDEDYEGFDDDSPPSPSTGQQKKKPTNNSNGGRTMAVKTLTKPEAVEFLTVNCDCWKAKGATKTLNALPEDTLNTLVASEQLATAVRNRLGEKAATLTVNQLAESLADPEVELELIDDETPVENCDMGGGEMEEEDAEAEGTEAEEAPPPAFKKKGKKKMPPVPPPTGNSAPRRMTMEEWNAVAPLEVIERDTRAKQVVNGERDRIVSKLVANSAARTKEAKDQLRRALNAKSLDDLNLMAMLQVNRKAAADDRAPVSVPNYGGLGHSYEEPVYNEGVNEDGSINDDEGMLVHNTAKVKWADEVKLYAPVKKAM